MKVYFVIPVYKVEEYLDRCIDSVLAQTYEAVEIVLVDDGSPDSCPEICDRYADKYENIKVIHKENGGLSDARNAGIGYVTEIASEEDFITFLDSDDFVHPEYTEKMVSLCKKYSCDAAQCEYEKGDKDCFTPSEEKTEEFSLTSEEALLGYTLKSSAWGKLYKVTIFKEILYPVGVYNEDEFTTYRAVFAAEKVAFTSEKLIYYYQRSSSIMVEIARKLKNNPRRYDFLKAYEERIEFFEERKQLLQVMKTREKICTDIILRYCEQMSLEKEERDTDCSNGTYMKIYRENFALMIKRKGMPIKRRLMYIAFYIFPYSAVLAGKIFALRK